MKLTVKSLIFLSILTSLCITLPPCLVKQKQALSDQCLLSLNVEQVISEQKKMSCPLCIITMQRKLYNKAEQFCFNSKEFPQCFIKYFLILLLNARIQQALQQDYQLFFKDSFKHNAILKQVLKDQKIIEALKKIQIKLMKNTNSSSNFFQLAITQFYLQKLQESQISLNKYFETSKQANQLLPIRLMCRILQQQSKHYDALNFLNKKLKQLQTELINDPYLYHLKGNFLMHHLKFKQAIKQFNKANELFTSNQFYRNYLTFEYGFQISNYNIGLCYQKINQPNKALHYYQKVAKSSNFEQAEPLNALGNVYVQMYQKQSKKPELLKKAQFYYQQSLLKNPQYYLSYYNLGYLNLLQKKFKEAQELFQKALSIKPDTKNAQYGRIKALLFSQKKKEAQQLIDLILKNKDETTFVQIISILNELNQNQYALQLINYYDSLIKSAESYEWKGMIQYSLDKFSAAKQSFSTAIFKGSKSTYCCQLLQDYEGALKNYAISNKIQKRQQTKKKVFEIQNIILEKASQKYGKKDVIQQF